MKYFLLFWTLLLIPLLVNSQTKIVETQHPDALANHNQRKIIRDLGGNIFISYMDYNSVSTPVIKGIFYERNKDLWNEPVLLGTGTQPTLALSKEDVVHLIYVSEGPTGEITHRCSKDLITWSQPKTISEPGMDAFLPVADTDASGKVNLFWLEKKAEKTALMYATFVNETSSITTKEITRKNEISDIAVANHLLFGNDDMMVGYQFDGDSLAFLFSGDHMKHFSSLLNTKGTQPAITMNAIYPSDAPQSYAKMLYIDTSGTLIEFPWFISDHAEISLFKLHQKVDLICVDDVLPPIGYSYLIMQEGKLYHVFAGGFGTTTFMDTISTSPFHPSIAYKSFNMEYVDFVYMQVESDHFGIYYKRDEKLEYVDTQTPIKENGIDLIGFPNPFSQNLTIKATSIPANGSQYSLEIYNAKSMLVNQLKADPSPDAELRFTWEGTDSNGVKVTPGVYAIVFRYGKKLIAKKVIYSGDQ